MGICSAGVENKTSFKMEYRIRTKEGNQKWVWEQGQGIFSNEGEFLALEGFITDITAKVEVQEKLSLVNQELEAANEELTASNEEFEAMNEELSMSQIKIELSNAELKESKRKFETLLDNLPGMAYRCRNDQDWTMEYLSDGCYELTGYKAEDLIGNRKYSYNDIIHPDDRAKVWDWVQDAINEQKSFEMRYRYRIIALNGTTRWVWEKGKAIYNSKGEVEALEGFVTDISDLVHKDQLLRQAQKMETVGTLASGLAHDFNNILGGIVGSLSFSLEFYPRNY